RFSPSNPLADETSVRVKFAGSEPALVIFSEPLIVSPGLMSVRLKTAWPSLEMDCDKEPEVTALMAMPRREVKIAPERTATAPAASSVACGIGTFLARLTRRAVVLWAFILWLPGDEGLKLRSLPG